MGRTCRGICILHKSPTMGNGLMYQFGQKRCTFCGLFLAVETVRCPCCKAVLRTKPRSKKKEIQWAHGDSPTKLGMKMDADRRENAYLN